MKKALITSALLAALLLSGCADTTSSEVSLSNQSSESILQTTEQHNETESTVDTPVEETQIETEDNYIRYPSHIRLMYNGEVYGELIASSQVEIDGKYYELEGDEAFIDAERMKNECEYIGQSISVLDDHVPSRELELTYANSELPCELYKIDEHQILVYSAEEFEIPERYSEWAIVYPGTYRIQFILVNDIPGELQYELIAKYYRYEERFPEDYPASDKPQDVFPPEGITAPTTSSTLTDENSAQTYEEKIAPITSIPSTKTSENPDVIGEIIEPLFELDGVSYEWDIEEGYRDFLMDEGGNILLETRDGLISPSDYNDGTDIVAALSSLDTLDFVGIVSNEFADMAGEHLYRYNEKLLAYASFPDGMQYSTLLRDSDYDPNQYYCVRMYKPCK